MGLAGMAILLRVIDRAGPTQGLRKPMLVVGAALMVLAFLGRWPARRRLLARLYAVIFASAFALWIAEVALTYGLADRRPVRVAMWTLRGLYEIGEHVPVRMVANYQGTFDDGVISTPVSTNSHGDRDDEPQSRQPGVQRLMLVGDSFAWGYALTDEQRIDRRIEHHGEGKLDAYNIGVQGYGTRSSRLRLLESDWWRGDAVYYLFFNNDLANDNVVVQAYVMVDGYALPRGPADQPVEIETLHAKVQQAHENGGRHPRAPTLKGTLGLPLLRGVLGRVRDENLRLNGYPDSNYAPGNIEIAVSETEQMAALAESRGASFTVVILPAVGEAQGGAYSRQVTAYIEGIRALGLEVLEVREALSAEDYFGHDPHFSPSGADIVGAAIAEHALSRRK